jgi:hypothetical protein
MLGGGFMQKILMNRRVARGMKKGAHVRLSRQKIRARVPLHPWYAAASHLNPCLLLSLAPPRKNRSLTLVRQIGERGADLENAKRHIFAICLLKIIKFKPKKWKLNL